MKKIIILLAIIIASNVCFAQSDTSNYVTNGDVEKLVDKYSAKLEASILSLAETLKQPAEYVYEVLIKQQYVKAYASFIPWIIFVMLLPVFTLLLKKGLIIDRYENVHGLHNYFYANDSFTVITVVVGILAAASLIAGAVCIQYIMQGFMNPDYGAIKDITDLIK